MAWNPETYNKFKAERFAPFYDVLALVKIKPNMDVIDLGCGTGELTEKLANTLPNAKMLGVDSSKEMLEDARAFASDALKFEQRTIEEQLTTNQKWDLIFSNAAIQWVDNHETLLPEIINTLKPNGQLAIQIPSQNDNILNQILLELVQEEPYQSGLKGWKRSSPVLSLDEYAQIFFENGCKDMTLYEKIYPLIVPNQDELYNFISGSSLVPYFERMNGTIKENFITEFKNRIHKRFPKKPVLYAFKRIIMEARF
ncbi:methyltransferase domain-containing protein [Flavobacterium sp. '19STA2R22 D10 B1']|uniref:methyltransferase domain-containing protein n=1 Tax=Flavobacterium aerium TaxID=3037261 RepID=UPI00278BF5C0|nr:methyltransferase domain-containing protein [Flavobacterium sp. '19STA2R22 D10 B1']